MALLAPAVTLAQQAVITGTVTGAQDEPLAGANVLIEELSLGAAADPTGRYTITVPDAQGQTVTLSARFIGYTSQQRAITLPPGEQTQNFQLSEDLIGLEEVVVTGVGERTETRRLGIDVAAVNAEALQAAPALTVESALARLPERILRRAWASRV